MDPKPQTPNPKPAAAGWMVSSNKGFQGSRAAVIAKVNASDLPDKAKVAVLAIIDLTEDPAIVVDIHAHQFGPGKLNIAATITPMALAS